MPRRVLTVTDVQPIYQRIPYFHFTLMCLVLMLCFINITAIEFLNYILGVNNPHRPDVLETFYLFLKSILKKEYNI